MSNSGHGQQYIVKGEPWVNPVDISVWGWPTGHKDFVITEGIGRSITRFAITHLPTGASVFDCIASIPQAKKLTEQIIAKAGIDWSKVTRENWFQQLETIPTETRQWFLDTRNRLRRKA